MLELQLNEKCTCLSIIITPSSGTSILLCIVLSESKILSEAVDKNAWRDLQIHDVPTSHGFSGKSNTCCRHVNFMAWWTVEKNVPQLRKSI